MERIATGRLHRFSVDDYYRMAEIDVLAPGVRVELLDGQVVDMSPIGIGHSMCVDQLTELFAGRIRKRAFVRVQNPMRIDGFNEPEPDLTLYAKAGIPEVWLVDLVGKKVTVCRAPKDGYFTDITDHKPPVTIAPTAFPDLDVVLSELF